MYNVLKAFSRNIQLCKKNITRTYFLLKEKIKFYWNVVNILIIIKDPTKKKYVKYFVKIIKFINNIIV